MKIARNKTAQQGPGRGYLDGQMLIAMPAMNDERFSRAVIYVCAHSTEGAMGIIVNHPAANIKFPDLLVQLEVIPASERIQLPTRAEEVKVLKGGPVETGRGFEHLIHRRQEMARTERLAQHPQDPALLRIL